MYLDVSHLSVLCSALDTFFSFHNHSMRMSIGAEGSFDMIQRNTITFDQKSVVNVAFEEGKIHVGAKTSSDVKKEKI